MARDSCRAARDARALAIAARAGAIHSARSEGSVLKDRFFTIVLVPVVLSRRRGCLDATVREEQAGTTSNS